ncbi:MAG: MBL fold metallo-hydrolase [Parachlamydiales bacterium]|jgi:L-ascorbate metabolism protein UlaG (beta-lactamase superfamily)
MMNYPISDHFDGRKFRNLDPTAHSDKNLWDIIKWRWSARPKPWPLWIDNMHLPNIASDVSLNEVSVTFINHSTCLVQLNGINILTDPVFSARVSPFSFIGPRRRRFPGIALDSLPRIDVVTISHNHYDHLDVGSLAALNARFSPLFITPLNNASLLKEVGIDQCIELDWWQERPLMNGKIALVPAQHWSARGIFDRCKALWGGFIYQFGGITIYFAGDTGYNTHFKTIYEKYGAPDISLLPIGVYEPRWFMQKQHMNPEDAVKAHLDLKSKFSMGIHQGTFQLSDEGQKDPANSLQEHLIRYKVDPERFISPENGQTVSSQNL